MNYLKDPESLAQIEILAQHRPVYILGGCRGEHCSSYEPCDAHHQAYNKLVAMGVRNPHVLLREWDQENRRQARLH